MQLLAVKAFSFLIFVSRGNRISASVNVKEALVAETFKDTFAHFLNVEIV